MDTFAVQEDCRSSAVLNEAVEVRAEFSHSRFVLCNFASVRLGFYGFATGKGAGYLR